LTLCPTQFGSLLLAQIWGFLDNNFELLFFIPPEVSAKRKTAIAQKEEAHLFTNETLNNLIVLSRFFSYGSPFIFKTIFVAVFLLSVNFFFK
jgi:hypothetical protein